MGGRQKLKPKTPSVKISDLDLILSLLPISSFIAPPAIHFRKDFRWTCHLLCLWPLQVFALIFHRLLLNLASDMKMRLFASSSFLIEVSIRFTPMIQPHKLEGWNPS